MCEEGKRICSTCKIPIILSEFYKHKHNKSGYHSQCKTCMKKVMKPKSKEVAIRDAKKYALAHPGRVKASFKKYYDANKESLRQKRKVYLESESGREKVAANLYKRRDKINARRKELKKAMSPKSKMAKAVRDRFHKVVIRMKRGCKSFKTVELVGCSFDDLKLHIERQFVEGMSWNNHGNGDSKWNVDHIKPLFEFNLLDLDQQKIAFHYSNLRPLWFIENMKRHRKSWS